MDSEREKVASIRALARRPSPAPWIAVALTTVLAFAVGRLTRLDPPPPPPPPRSLAPAARPAPNPAELGALRSCVGEFGALQERVDRECPALAQAIVAGEPTAAPGAASPTDGGVPAVEAAQAAAEQADAARRTAFRRAFMARVVGVTGPAGEWLADYVCLVDDLRNRTVRDIEATFGDPAAYPEAVDEIVAESKQERDAILGDIEARLGPQRYARLRELGGLSMLSLACRRKAEAEAEKSGRTDAAVADLR